MEIELNRLVVYYILMIDPYNIINVEITNNNFSNNSAKIGSCLIHPSGYDLVNHNLFTINNNSNNNINHCLFDNNIVTDTGTIIVQNSNLKCDIICMYLWS